MPFFYEISRKIDFGWILSRLPLKDTLFQVDENQSQVIPAWTGFNAKLHDQIAHRACTVGYCQVIEASPTELPTVYTVLRRSLDMANQLGQQDVIVVFDQAIYAKALDVKWQCKEEFKRIVLRLGSFHTICSFIAVIGKRFADAGLSDVFIESGVVGSGSLAGVLQGKHYNRAVRMHKVIRSHILPVFINQKRLY